MASRLTPGALVELRRGGGAVRVVESKVNTVVVDKYHEEHQVPLDALYGLGKSGTGPRYPLRVGELVADRRGPSRYFLLEIQPQQQCRVIRQTKRMRISHADIVPSSVPASSLDPSFTTLVGRTFGPALMPPTAPATTSFDALPVAVQNTRNPNLDALRYVASSRMIHVASRLREFPALVTLRRTLGAFLPLFNFNRMARDVFYRDSGPALRDALRAPQGLRVPRQP